MDNLELKCQFLSKLSIFHVKLVKNRFAASVK